MADKVEPQEEPKPKKQNSFEYKLHSHGDKLAYLLDQMFALEGALFAHNINMLDEKHSMYPEWKEKQTQLENEIYRLRYIYEKMGGAWENLQDIEWEQDFDEYGEPIDDTD